MTRTWSRAFATRSVSSSTQSHFLVTQNLVNCIKVMLLEVKGNLTKCAGPFRGVFRRGWSIGEGVSAHPRSSGGLQATVWRQWCAQVPCCLCHQLAELQQWEGGNTLSHPPGTGENDADALYLLFCYKLKLCRKARKLIDFLVKVKDIYWMSSDVDAGR